MTPRRIQRRRVKGWRMPPECPWREDAMACARDQYARFVAHQLPVHELAGKDICDWCAVDQPCHGDVLLERANPKE